VRSDWILPLVIAGGVGLVLTPAARYLARRRGMVDRPSRHKRHQRVTPYAGGVAIAVAVIAGRLVRPPDHLESVVIGLAAVLAIMGLIDDDRPLPPLPRLLVEAACGVGVVAAGLRLVGTGVPGLDAVLTVLLVVAVINATNLMDNLDGLAAGVVAVAAAGVGLLGWLEGNPHTVTDAASVVGACLAFLAFNGRPASIFMGDAGSLFLGFLLAVLAIGAGTGLPEPASLVVPLLFVALPLTDSITVVVGRLRHQRSILQGGRDHLSHRLAGTGIGGGPAVVTLVAVQGVLSALAVLTARRALPLWAAVVAALTILVVTVAVAGTVRVYPRGEVGLPRWLVWGGPAVVVVAGALAVPAALALVRAHAPATAGAAELEDAVTAAHAGQFTAASSYLAAAQRDLARAQADLQSPLVSPGLAYPVLSTNLDAARTLVSSGLAMARTGTELIAADQGYPRWIHGGTVNLQALAQAAPGLRQAAAVADRSSRAVARLSRAYLVPTVASATNRLQRALGTALEELDAGAQAATYLPPLLGADGPRRYFLAVQNPTESRGTGGLIGDWAVVVADDGHIQLQDFQPLNPLDSGGSSHRTLKAPATYLAQYQRFDPAQDWQNVNMSPDFPTVGAVISDLFPQSGGSPVDGVVAVDPAGLQALLTLTGPIDVTGWPVPITAANVEHVTLFDAYLRYTDEVQRSSFLGDVAHAAFSAFTRLQVGDPSELVAVLGPAARGRHIQVYSSRAAEEAYLNQVGLAGALPSVRSDLLSVTTQNVAANKIDYYLHRAISYHVTLAPAGSPGSGPPSRAIADATFGLTLENTAPASGLPPSIIGPYEPGFRAGEEATYLSIYSPLSFASASLDGAPVDLSSATDAGSDVYSAFVDLQSGQRAAFTVNLSGSVTLLPGGWYELDLPHQPVVNPDQVSVTLNLAPGWKVRAARGARVTGSQSVSAQLTQTADQALWVQVAADPGPVP
jgi:UDP-N-acetylmuramyl pentapeptide phosphotransferase/UDP-N-acetylglucosamine-1-phosphate transferase